MNRFEDELRRAAGAGAPSTPTGFGARMVARGRRRRAAGRATAGTAALLVAGLVAVGVADLGATNGAPVVTNPIDGAPSPAPSPSTSASDEVGAQAQPVPEPTPTLPIVLPTGEPSPEPSGSPEPTPSPRPSSSPSSRPGGAPADDGTNDGATDTGVTATTVTIATLVEASTTARGSEPAPSTSSTVSTTDVRRAMEAFAAYAEEELGPIHGRTIEVVFFETEGNPSTAGRMARDACNQAFAMIGASLGTDQSQTVDQFTATARCPDLRGEVQAGSAQGHHTWRVRQIDPETPALGPWAAWQDRFPDAVASAAWIDEDSVGDSECSGGILGTCYQTQDRDIHEDWIYEVQELTARRGWDWTYDYRHPKGDTSWYGAAAREMEQLEVEFLRLDTALVDTIRFAQQARQNGNWWPSLVTLDDKHYLNAVLNSAGDDLEGAEIALDHLPWDDEGANPVLDRYLRWIDPAGTGVQPTRRGLYAWAAAEQLVESLRALGPAPTREDLADRWNDVRGWTAGGALAPRPLTGSVGTKCSVVVRADSAKNEWVRGSGRRGTFTC